MLKQDVECGAGPKRTIGKITGHRWTLVDPKVQLQMALIYDRTHSRAVNLSSLFFFISTKSAAFSIFQFSIAATAERNQTPFRDAGQWCIQKY